MLTSVLLSPSSQIRASRGDLGLHGNGSLRPRLDAGSCARPGWLFVPVDKFDADRLFANIYNLDQAPVLLSRHLLRIQAQIPGFDYIDREKMVRVTVN